MSQPHHTAARIISLTLGLIYTAFGLHLFAAGSPPQITSLAPGSLIETYIGQTVRLQVETDQPVDRFTAKGLPPGLTLASDGLIMGKPTRCQSIDPATGLPRPYQVTFTARNTSGAGPSSTVQWRIYSILPGGDYEGLLDHAENLAPASLAAGALKLSISSTGAISGQFLIFGNTHRFTQMRLIEASENGMKAETIINRGRWASPLTLTITTTDRLARKATVRVHDPLDFNNTSSYDRTGILQRHAFSKHAPATAYVGAYNLSIQVPDEELDSVRAPLGCSYLLAKISTRGLLTFRGRMADGYTITGSHLLTMGEDSGPLRIPFFKNFKRGAYRHSTNYAKNVAHIIGWIDLPGPSTLPAPLLASGTVQWLSGASGFTSGRTDDFGFECSQKVTGGLYQPPTTGMTIMNLAPTEPNISAYFNQIGIGSYQTFTLDAKHKVKLPPHRADHPILRLTFNAKQGTFKGILRYPNENPKLVLQSSIEGIIHSPNGPCEGFFAFPSLPPPSQPQELPKNPLLFSGRIRFTPLP